MACFWQVALRLVFERDNYSVEQTDGTRFPGVERSMPQERTRLHFFIITGRVRKISRCGKWCYPSIGWLRHRTSVYEMADAIILVSWCLPVCTAFGR